MINLFTSRKKLSRYFSFVAVLVATFFILGHTTPIAHAAVEISDGSVQALYHFNNQDLTDSSGKTGRNGVQGSTPVTFTSASAKVGAFGMSTNGGNGYFTATSTIMDLSGDFTIGFWMQPQASFGSGPYFFLRNISSINNNTGITYAIACAAGKLEFVHNGVCEVSSTQSFSPGTWYWIEMQRQGSRLDAYLNDSLIQSVTDSLTMQSSTGVRFNGAMDGSGVANLYYDEIFFATKAISTSTRDALYNAGAGDEVCVMAGCNAPVKNVNVAVILAEPFGTPHNSSSISVQPGQPCKLLTATSSYPNGHSVSYFNDLLFCVKNYHMENSYGSINLNFKFFDHNGDWYKITDSVKTYSYYATNSSTVRQFVTDAIAVATSSGADLSGFDAITVVHSGPGVTSTEAGLIHSQLTSNQSSSIRVTNSEDEPVGAFAHELGHVLGILTTPENSYAPDVYNMGNVEHWDIMARGAWNSSNTGTDPPQMSSYTKEFLQFLHYNTPLPRSFTGATSVPALASEKLGDGIVRYNLLDNTIDDNTIDDNTTPYYILEARDKTIGRWDTSIPIQPTQQNALVLYYVNPLGYSKYGYTTFNGTKYLNNQCRRINIPNGGVLTNGVGDHYTDYNNLVRFSILSATTSTIITDIRPFSIVSDFITRYIGIILDPKFGFTISTCPFSGNVADLPPQPPIPPAGKPIYAFNLGDISGYHTGSVFRIRYEWINFPEDAPIAYQLILILIPVSYCIYLSISNRKRMGGRADISTQGIKDLFRPTELKIFLLAMTVLLDQFPKRWLFLSSGYDSLGVSSNPSVFDIFIPGAIFDVLIWYAFASIAASAITKITRKLLRIIIIILLLVLLLGIAGYRSWLGSHTTTEQFLLNKAPSNNLAQAAHQIIGAPPQSSISPDLDLHAITPDGLHVGMNYVTGQYENQIPGAIVSGDNEGSPEWILIPATTTAKFYISSQDNEAFLSANPGIASQLATTTDSYNIYARYFDPNTGIFTSATSSATIAPAQSVVYQTSGTSTIAVSSGTIYLFGGFLPPVIADGSGLYNLGRTLPVKFQLTDQNGNFISTASAHLFVAKIQDSIIGTDQIALSTGGADTGNIFRYDAVSNQYIFNLDTGTLSTGTWQLKATLDDGTSHVVLISLQ